MDHLWALYNQIQAESGLYVGQHLTYKHVNLTSFSKMKVNLTVQVELFTKKYILVTYGTYMQVLTSSVSHAFDLMDHDEFSETAKFCFMFD